jgi:hypothetical protein
VLTKQEQDKGDLSLDPPPPRALTGRYSPYRRSNPKSIGSRRRCRGRLRSKSLVSFRRPVLLELFIPHDKYGGTAGQFGRSRLASATGCQEAARLCELPRLPVNTPGRTSANIMQELEHLTGSYQQLKQAQAKFRSCVSDISELTPTSKGKRFTFVSWYYVWR